jgi:hypothetical protein
LKEDKGRGKQIPNVEKNLRYPKFNFIKKSEMIEWLPVTSYIPKIKPFPHS